ncbi:DUF3256 family protein [Dysgonomonas sp. 25]|uniref:DUF3256 family protein n=1 Tax=Dysgonomonas sp. 25 TaxID=2302933 RepID=UPI0013D5CD34|nr:DUF3256 family protein [Dysgonomonas sp. 25]
MKRFSIILSLLVLTILTASGQNITDVFNNVPADVIFGLTVEQKNRLVSNPKDTALSIIDNNLYEEIKRTAISDDFIAIETSDVATIQIKLLPLINDSKIICVVKTFCTGICDSEIAFYTDKWAPIDKGTLLPLLTSDWYIKPDADRNSEDFKAAVSVIDINPEEMILAPNDYTLKMVLDIEGYLNDDDYKALKPYLLDSKTFTWDKVSFK